MALDYSLSTDRELLLVVTTGFDDGVNEAVSYGEAIIKFCVKNKCTQVLMDETEMTSALDEVSQYQMVQRLLAQIPDNLDIAIVVNLENYKESSFGVMVAENRGVHIRIFTELEPAREWLAQQND